MFSESKKQIGLHAIHPGFLLVCQQTDKKAVP
jgi:hypothetical protein